MKTILSGCFTIQDDQLFKYLYHLKQTQNIEIEPSAAAGFLGPSYLLNSDSGKEYLNKHKITENQIVKSNHIVWTTGGLFVPQEEYQIFLQKGKDLVSNQK